MPVPAVETVFVVIVPALENTPSTEFVKVPVPTVMVPLLVSEYVLAPFPLSKSTVGAFPSGIVVFAAIVRIIFVLWFRVRLIVTKLKVFAGAETELSP